MRHGRVVWLLGAVLMVAIVLSIFGSVVLGLWNWLMPTIFKLPAITFWQAIGLLALSWIFFGSWRGFHGHRHHWRSHRRRFLRERWAAMSPEQRQEFRKAIEHRCGRRTAPGPGRSTATAGE